MKKLSLLYILGAATLLNSQELDQSFLSSLPPEIRQDFIDQSQTKQQDINKNINNPDTRIDNLEKSLLEAEQALIGIKNQLARGSDDDDLKRFGEGFFSSFQSTYLPINQPNFDSSYILDIGDALTIQLVGSELINEIFEVPIKRDGTINIEDVGNISIAGLSLGDATNLIENNLANAMVGVETFISLSSLRDVNVLIVGNVKNPGMYTLSGGSSVLSLLNAAGGIDKNGSYRSIEHKRNNILINQIDLYKVFTNGDLEIYNQLRSGDVVIVKPTLGEIKITGAFANQARYEYSKNDTMSKLIDIAGPLTPVSNSLFLINSVEGNKLLTREVSYEEAKSIKVKSGDSIELIGATPDLQGSIKVEISGQVNIPGTYYFSSGDSLNKLINEAGGYTDDAYPLGGVMLRERIVEVEKKFRDRSYYEIVKFLVTSMGAQSQGASRTLQADNLIGILSLLKSFEPIGRVTTNFELNTDEILKLEDGDKIHIPRFSPEVFVFGEVVNPGSIPYSDKYTLSDYIKGAGSYNRVADTDRVIIISPDGRTDMVSYGIFKELFNGSANTNILPGTTIYVPIKVGKLDGLNLASNVAPIISSFALSIASLNSINN